MGHRNATAHERLLVAWDKQYAVSGWERERNRRIVAIVGHSNPFVTGQRQWTRGPRNVAEGIVTQIPVGRPSSSPVLGNSSARIYHLPQGCPSYSKISGKNRVEFASEAAAAAASFRRAGNCRYCGRTGKGGRP